MAKAPNTPLSVKLGPDGLPTEIQIFTAGPNETSKGTFTFDDKAAASVMASYADQGNTLVVDYEHQTAANPPVEAPAAGRFSLEVRDGGLWAVDLKWSDRASEYLADKEYLYYSPWFDHDEEGRITRLRNIALTNFPATKNMPMLVAAKGSTTADAKEEKLEMTEDMQKACADLMAAIQADPMPDPEEMMKLLKACMMAYGAEAETEIETPAKDPAVTEVAPPSELAALSEVVALTGKGTTAEALGKIAAWKDASAQVTTLSARVTELEAEKLDREFASVIESGTKAGKLTPAMVGGKFVAALRANGSSGLSQFKAYLEEAPAVLKTTETKQPQTSEPVTLSADEEHYARLQGMDLRELIAHKVKRNNERTGG